MNKFWKYTFPGLYGLLIYTSIRLVNDVISGTRFWERHWSINAIEISATLIVSYIFLSILNHFERKFSKRPLTQLNLRTLLKEFGQVYFFCALVLNLTVIPVAALTDDGLQLYDVININLIPMLYLLLYYAISRGNSYMKAFYEQQVQIQKIGNDQLKTELKFLKAQYHPHFLFNALNTIYFQMDEDVTAAKKSVEKFSELLRYQLYDQQKLVPVKQEVEYILSFVELQKFRASSQLKLQLDFEMNKLDGLVVYPLLFLPLVENAFKYVGGDYRITLSMTTDNDGLIFKVENDIRKEIPLKESTGIGLENLKRRLELLYPKKHSFITKNDKDFYSAELRLRTSDV